MNLEDINNLPHAQFPALKDDFYKKLNTWRESVREEDSKLYENCVYILTSNVPIPRKLKDDYRCILYIGKGLMTKNRERPGDLINAINKTANKHHGGNKYRAYNETYQIKDMKITLYFTDKPREIEKTLLENYFGEFGELPLLNTIF